MNFQKDFHLAGSSACHLMKETIGNQFISNWIPHVHSFQTQQLAVCLTKDKLCIISAKSEESCLKLSLSTILPKEKNIYIYNSFSMLNYCTMKSLKNCFKTRVGLPPLYTRYLQYTEVRMHLKKEPHSLKTSSTPASLWHQCWSCPLQPALQRPDSLLRDLSSQISFFRCHKT